MHCSSCEKIIKKQMMKIDGVKDCGIDYSTQNGWVEFDPEKTDIDSILYSIEEKGYDCKINEAPKQSPFTRHVKPAILTLGLIIILFGGYQVAETTLGIGIFPDFGNTVSLALLFVLGILTGFHCVGMCGGFVLSYTTKNTSKKSRFLNSRSHIAYGSGKMISYTVIGALFGLIGSVFVFTPMIRGFAAIFAGIFLMIFGINMLNIFPALRRVRIPQPGFLSRFSMRGQGKNGPMKVGLLNGLMIACGPLQALYIYAAGTGSVIGGATALFAFGLGTLPILFGFGIFASYVSKTMTHRILKVSGVIVLVLGMVMLNRGLALTGTGLDSNSILAGVSAQAASQGTYSLSADGYQEIRMEVNRYGWKPDRFALKKGVPVKWIIDGKEINGCNNAIQVPKLGLNFDIKRGEQVIEFTPEDEGLIPFSCWMGMIPGVFIVKDDMSLDSSDVQKELDSVQLQAGSCGGSCGSPTCGARPAGGSCGCSGR
jgi:sulfite exporter TauE/SafE/copper chaperone CopZ